ncbi:MAG TPA: hypothetical protein VFK50_08790 [Sphingomicrobium sp.]|nr:hypothetical protein [Sphingomicrobium sp.]
MQRAATDVMQSVLFSAVLEAIAAMKSASGGLPNNLLRDVQAIHPNVTFNDLPKEVQASITSSVRSAFTMLLKEGYAVAPRDAAPLLRRPPPRHDGPPRRGPGGGPDRRQPRGDRPSPDRPRGPRGPGSGPGGGSRGPGGPGSGPRGPGGRPRKPKGKPKLS